MKKTLTLSAVMTFAALTWGCSDGQLVGLGGHADNDGNQAQSAQDAVDSLGDYTVSCEELAGELEGNPEEIGVWAGITIDGAEVVEPGSAFELWYQIYDSDGFLNEDNTWREGAEVVFKETTTETNLFEALGDSFCFNEAGTVGILAIYKADGLVGPHAYRFVGAVLDESLGGWDTVAEYAVEGEGDNPDGEEGTEPDGGGEEGGGTDGGMEEPDGGGTDGGTTEGGGEEGGGTDGGTTEEPPAEDPPPADEPA